MIVPLSQSSFLLLASSLQVQNALLVSLPALMRAKRFLYSLRYSLNTSSPCLRCVHVLVAGVLEMLDCVSFLSL